MFVQLVGGGELLEPTGMKHRHPVPQIERLLLLVGDEHGRDPDPFDERPQLIKRVGITTMRSEEHTSELQSHSDLVCRLLLEKKKHRIEGSKPPHLLRPSVV